MKNITRKNLISTLITISILAVGLLIYQKFSSMKKSTVSNEAVKKDRRKISVSTYNPGSEENAIEIDGRLSAHEQVNITSKVTGLLLNSNNKVKKGQYFSKGDLLFSIDKKEQEFNLKAQKSTLLTSITQMMPDLKFDYPDSFDKWIKYLNAYNVDNPIAELPSPGSDQEKYFMTNRNLYNQFYNIKSQETKLADYKIYAPFSGVVTEVNVYPGSLVSQGTPLATIINTSYYELETPVPLEYLQHIKIGQIVNLKSDELDMDWKGSVIRIGNQIDPNTQNIPLYIKVSGKGLKDGMYLKGDIKASPLNDVVKLSKNIFLNPNSIFVVEDSTLVIKELVSVKRSNDNVIVKGLTSNDMVVTGSLAGLFEGQKVTY
jgi:multidrug efflux pump subunit AcrA (membrane-fusion protein)